MNGFSIQEILIKIDQRLDILRVFDEDAPAVSLDPLSEVGLYISNDSLLGDLYRQYLEAQRNYVCTLKEHGADSAMTEIASDMSESAFCAMETRLIELRHEKELTAKVEAVQKKQREEYRKEIEARQAEYARRGIQQPESAGVSVKTSKLVTDAQKMMKNQNSAFWALFAMAFMDTSHFVHNTKAPRLDFAQAAA